MQLEYIYEIYSSQLAMVRVQARSMAAHDKGIIIIDSDDAGTIIDVKSGTRLIC